MGESDPNKKGLGIFLEDSGTKALEFSGKENSGSFEKRAIESALLASESALLAFESAPQGKYGTPRPSLGPSRSAAEARAKSEGRGEAAKPPCPYLLLLIASLCFKNG